MHPHSRYQSDICIFECSRSFDHPPLPSSHLSVFVLLLSELLVLVNRTCYLISDFAFSIAMQEQEDKDRPQ